MDHGQYVHWEECFPLEGGGELPELRIAYQTYGQPNDRQDNIILICHALTGNADPADWWSGLIGPGRLYDPTHYYIICANNLGSCYGTTGPASVDPRTGKLFGPDFPEVTIRDMVRAQQKWLAHLGIERVEVALGGSMGGQIILEWAIMEPTRFRHIVLMATNAVHSPWGIAFNETQRMAIEASLAVDQNDPEARRRGLEAARAIAMLSYRSYDGYQVRQTESDPEKMDNYKASSYQRYQGDKFARRFDLYSYLRLSKAMDSHHVGRGRGSVAQALQRIEARTLVIGLDTDLLFPLSEQVTIANHVPRARLEVVTSLYGHDGFLVECSDIAQHIRQFMTEGVFREPGKQYRLSVRSATVQEKGSHRALPGTERF